MIFAILDYCNYRGHKGRYSFSVLEKEGGRLATKVNFPKPEEIPPGSIMFHHSFNSIISWLIMYYTNGKWAHLALFTKNGYLADMTTAGKIKHPFSDYLDGNGYVSIASLRNLKREDWDNVAAGLEKDLGKKYGYLGVVIKFFKIILGFTEEYRLRFSFDIFILCGLFYMACIFLNMKGTAVITAVSFYTFIVIANIFRLKFYGKGVRF